MKKLAKNTATMVAEARQRISEVTAEQGIPLVDNEDTVFVDIRDIRERQRSGYVPGSFHAPRGMVEFWVDPESPYFKDIFAQEKRFIFYCASGWRSALTVATLKDMGFEAEHLKEGFSGWQKADGPTEQKTTD